MLSTAREVVSLLVAMSAALAVRAEYRGPRWQVYLFKPLTTALLLALALATPPYGAARYQLAVAIGLALSLVGDVFLMLPGDRFMPGLSSFLLAHFAYLVAFTTDVQLAAAPVLFAPFAVFGLAILALLWRRLGRLQVPVALYVLVIVSMAGQAAGRAWLLRNPAAALAASGAVLFVASDTLLSLNRFRRPFPSAQALILGSYFLAQWLIAASV
jgi:uncharacterized membrane protein YhhN